MTPLVSVVVVCYEMARAVSRTLLSLSPAYQRGAPSYEVILVDNGSRDPPRGEAFPALDGCLFVHHLPNPSASPVAALNFGIARARGALIGAWIDGARMASPGIIQAATRAAALDPNAVVATPNYHLGPGHQFMTMQAGYDTKEEDRLLHAIGWPADGYRLFEIATPVWMSGEDGPMLESNALFLKRAMWDALGGYDAAFSSAGGGAANADMFRRACEAPGAHLVRIRGEATFHQIHGGVASNPANGILGVIKQISGEYFRIRGKPLAPVRMPGLVFDGGPEMAGTR